jgi:PGF-pre-PGF domain-containing protein
MLKRSFILVALLSILTILVLANSIDFTSPTVINNGFTGNNYTTINVTASDSTNNVSILINFNNSLTAWWRMDDVNSSGDPTDYLGIRNATLQGNTIINSTNGNIGNGSFFDGASDYIDIVTTRIVPHEEYTASAWFKISGGSGTTRAIFETAPEFIISASLAANNKVSINADRATSDETYNSNLEPTLNKWYFLTSRYDNGNLSLFINGTLLGSSATGSGDLRPNSGGFHIGTYRSADDRWWNGSLDDVSIFTRALSDREITALYSNSSTKYLLANFTNLSEETYPYIAYSQDSLGNINQTQRNITCDFSPPSLIKFSSLTEANKSNKSNSPYYAEALINESRLKEMIFNWNGTNHTLYDDSLVLLLNFNNISSIGENETHLVDISSYSNNATIHGATYSTDGIYGGSLTFDGDDDYIEINTSSSFGANFFNNTNFTMSLWVKATLTGDDNQDLFSGTTYDPRLMVLYTGNIIYYAYIDTTHTEILVATEALTADNWINIAFVSNSSNYTFFVNGVKRESTSNLAIDGGATSFRFGDSLWGGRSFNGSIDQLMIFNRSLSQAEITQLQNISINKYNTTNFTISSNKTVNAGEQTYQVFAKDTVNNTNQTDLRTVIILKTTINNNILNYTDYWVKTNETYTFNMSNCTSSYSSTNTYNWTFNGTLVSNETNFTLTGSDYPLGTYALVANCYGNRSTSDTRSHNIEIINSSDFTILFMTDPHMEDYPWIFDNVTYWAAEMRNALNIKFFTFGGDFADAGATAAIFTNVNNSMSRLDGTIPYGLSPGNHDYNDNSLSRNLSIWNTYFPLSRYSSTSTWGGHQNTTEGNINTYHNFSFGNYSFVLFQLEFCPRNETLDWLNSTLLNSTNKNVIYVSHQYLYQDSSRTTTGDVGACNTYAGMTDGNDGEEVYQKVLQYYNHTFLTLNGHHLGTGQAYLNSTIKDDVTLHQVFSAFHHKKDSGNGYMKIIRFSPNENKIYFKSYSPFDNQYVVEIPNRNQSDHELIVNHTLKITPVTSSPSSNRGGGGGSGGGGSNGFFGTGIDYIRTYSNSVVNSISFQLTQNAMGNYPTVTDISSFPSFVKKITDRQIYNKFAVNTLIKNEIIKFAIIDFEVSKKWLTDRSLKREDITLLRYNEDTNQWEDNNLSFDYANDDTSNYYYQATVPGFSYFTIVEKSSTIIEQPQPKTNNEPEKVIDEKTTPLDKIKEETKKNPIMVIIASILIIISLLVLIIAIKKGRHKEQPSQPIMPERIKY